MKGFKFLIIGGVLLLLALPVFASNGNPRFNNVIPGVEATEGALLFCNTMPYQDDNATAGSLYLLVRGVSSDPLVNYYVDSTAYPGYTKYGVMRTPVTTANGYILIKDGTTKYAVKRFTLGTPVGPADEPFEASDIVWYNTGNPDAPSSLAERHGFETAQISWVLNPSTPSRQFNYSSIELTVTRVSDGAVIEATGGVRMSIITGTAVAGPYNIGELIDGRVLESDTEYSVSLVGVVRGKADGSVNYRSTPATIRFRTTAGGGLLPVTINLRRISGGHGVNSFAVPRVNAEVASSGVGAVDGTVCTTAYELVNAVNRIRGRGTAVPFVRTFGYWDPVSQTAQGETISSTDYPLDPLLGVGLRLSGIPLQPGKAYQLYIRPEPDADIDMTFDLR